MGNSRLERKLYLADWMKKRGNETPKAQAIRIANNVQAALAQDSECKIGLLYSANKNQVDKLNDHYTAKHGYGVPENILSGGHGQAEVFQAFIRHINGHWTPAERARVRIVGIPTSRKGGKDTESNSLSESEIQAAVVGVYNLMNSGYTIFGMEREGKRQNKDDLNPTVNELNIGGGVSSNWTTNYVGEKMHTRDKIFQKAMNPGGALFERVPAFVAESAKRKPTPEGLTVEEFSWAYQGSGEAPKKSFIQRYPRVSLGLGITAIVLAVALAVVATIATCGAAGVPLGFLGAGIAVAGAATITGGFTVFAAVGVAGFALAILSTIGGALGIHLARKEIEINKLAAKPTLIVSERMDPGSPDSDLSCSGSYRDLNQFMEEHRGTNRPSPRVSNAPAEQTVKKPFEQPDEQNPTPPSSPRPGDKR